MSDNMVFYNSFYNKVIYAYNTNYMEKINENKNKNIDGQKIKYSRDLVDFALMYNENTLKKISKDTIVHLNKNYKCICIYFVNIDIMDKTIKINEEKVVEKTYFNTIYYIAYNINKNTIELLKINESIPYLANDHNICRYNFEIIGTSKTLFDFSKEKIKKSKLISLLKMIDFNDTKLNIYSPFINFQTIFYEKYVDYINQITKLYNQ